MGNSKSGRVTLFRGMLGLCCLVGASIAAPPGDGRVKEDRNIGAYNNVGALIRAGYKIHTDQIPFAAPVQALPADKALRLDDGILLRATGRDEALGAIATPQTGGPTGCELDIECDDCNPCTADVCIAEVCQSTPLSQCDSCSDGLFCNGVERCSGLGLCLDAQQIKDPDPDPCINQPNTVCNDLAEGGNGACEAGCDPTVPDACNDGSRCSGVETCEEPRCVGGANDGNSCVDDAGCDSSLCRGLCRAGDPFCGRGTTCSEDGPCGLGRCCVDGVDGAQTCTNETKDDCEGGGGRWLGIGFTTIPPDFTCTDVAPSTEPNSGEDFQCPKYEAGITSGVVLDILGPAAVSLCPGGTPVRFREVGDDYTLSNAGSTDFFEITTVRLIGGFLAGTGSRMRISFYDASGTFIEDTITGFSTNSGVRNRTYIFGEKPVVPATGFVTIKPAAEFSPNNLAVLATVSGVNVGTNDAANVYVDTGSGLAVTSAASLGLSSGVLAIELVGNKVEGPTGACCDSETGVCEELLPWDCEGLFQGRGSSCNVCLTAPFVNCDADEDCRVCIFGSNENAPCQDDNECPGIGAFCESNPQCVSVPPACQISACCATDGSCEESKDGGFCSITTGIVCLSDAQCPGDETCEAACPSGSTSLGFGTTCEPNCCEQPKGVPGDAADTCKLAEKNHYIFEVPLAGDPPITRTWSNNNKAARFGDFVPVDSGGPGTCNSGIFNEDGGTRDRGWWHAFSITACADVRIDLCCTKERSGQIHQPQWALVFNECDPCLTLTGNVIVGNASVGTDTAANDRGAPFCAEDDLWQTFRSLPKGIYYHPIYSATGGHFGDYQLHITVGACPVAACCIPDGSCDVINQTDCDAAGGYWHGFGNIPPENDPVVNCGSGTPEDPFYCDLGACCTGPGQCEDRSGTPPCDRQGQPSTCMTPDICDTFGGSPTYIGGALCDYPLKPCPACAIEGEGNCLILDFLDGATSPPLLSDLTTPPYGTTTADDFIPSGDTIGSICVWGTYLDARTESNGGLGDDATNGCVGRVEDNFRVRIYKDAGGFPGALEAEVFVTGDNVFSSPLTDSAFEQIYGVPYLSYTLSINPPITLSQSGVPYWLEVANKTDTLTGGTEPVENTCYWHWAEIFGDDSVGNQYLVMGGGDRPDGGIGYVSGGAGSRSGDMAFCLGNGSGGGLNFTLPDTPLGGCCQCDDNCIPDTTLGECDDTLIGVWSLDNNCDTPCEPQEGITCAGGTSGSLAVGLDCGAGKGGPGGGAIIITDGLHGFDTTCAPTDGPEDVPDENLGGTFVNDIWFQYETTCTGRLVVSMCPTGTLNGAYDSYLALYHDGSNPTQCPPCPTDNTFLNGTALDETCNGIADGGAGISSNNIVFPGQCWLIRVGGFEQTPVNEAGNGLLDVACLAADCFPSSPPAIEFITPGPYPDQKGEPGPPVAVEKVRHLAIVAGDSGKQQAMRITFDDLPNPFDVFNTTRMWASAPKEICENSGQGGSVSLDDCGPHPASLKTYFVSLLDCDPFFMDWTTLPQAVNIYGEFIVPGASYSVQMIEQECLLTSEGSYSDALVISTSIWGDSVDDCTTLPCKPPDKSVDIVTDVTATLNKFQNFISGPDKARTDMEPALLDAEVNISDVTFVLNAFGGELYPFGAPPPPCESVSSGSR